MAEAVKQDDDTPVITFEDPDDWSPQSNVLIGYSSFEWTGDPLIRTADGASVRITQAIFKF
ncbi:MAG TPA: hypothetical protein PKA59_02285 [Chakrabartia sp.]|jgi:hypothetical protein|nr:hypothetical protein [Chakrabartia sp.]